MLCHLVPKTSWNQLQSVFLAQKPIPHLLIPRAEGFHPLPSATAGCDTRGACTVLTPAWQKLRGKQRTVRGYKTCVPGLRFVGQFLRLGCWYCSQPHSNTGNSCKPTCSLTNSASFIFLYRLLSRSVGLLEHSRSHYLLQKKHPSLPSSSHTRHLQTD